MREREKIKFTDDQLMICLFNKDDGRNENLQAKIDISDICYFNRLFEKDRSTEMNEERNIHIAHHHGQNRRISHSKSDQ